MAKADVRLPDGTSIKLEGTAAEMHEFLQRWKDKQETQRRTPKGNSQRPKLVDLIDTLIDGGFFKTPRDLASLKAGLEEMGHHYPVTTLSPVMLRQVRKRNLRRLKKDKRWMYTR